MFANLCLSWRRTLLLAAIAAALLAARGGSAQDLDFGSFQGLGKLGGGLGAQAEEATVSAEFVAATAERPAAVIVTAQIADGYHMYAIDQPQLPDGAGPQATKITLADGAVARLAGPWQALTPPQVHQDDVVWKGLELREHDGKAVWYAPLELAPGVDPAQVTIEGKLEGQVCNPNLCIPVRTNFTARLGGGAALAQLPAATPLATPTAPAPPADAAVGAGGAPTASGGLLTNVLLGMLGGLILNLMPCVLPVIGLKVLSFAKQGGQSRGRIFGLNLSYSAGLMTVFLLLATLAALVQLGLSDRAFGWGQLNTLWWFKVSMTALVFAMALAFLGVWELPIPGFATSGTAMELSAKQGLAGAFFMGMFTTLLATPCSGPFLGPVLGYTLGQPPATTYLLFASVGLGMAAPYLLIGAFPALVAWLPKPGAWMDTFKQLLGFVLLATVVYLFSMIESELFVPTLALLFAIWLGCWIVNRAPPGSEPAVVRWQWVKAIAAAAVLGGGAFSLLQPRANELPWQPYSPAALAAARAEGKTVLVDFTADWCLTCKTNSLVAINRREVRELVEKNGVVPLLADWTNENPAIEQALAELKSRSIPLLAVYPPEPGAAPIVLPDLLTQDKVLRALEEAGPSLGAARGGSEEASSPRPVAAAPEATDFGAREGGTQLQ